MLIIIYHVLLLLMSDNADIVVCAGITSEIKTSFKLILWQNIPTKHSNIYTEISKQQQGVLREKNLLPIILKRFHREYSHAMTLLRSSVTHAVNTNQQKTNVKMLLA